MAAALFDSLNMFAYWPHAWLSSHYWIREIGFGMCVWDPIESFENSRTHVEGCLWVSIFSMLTSAALRWIDGEIKKRGPAERRQQRGKKLELTRQYNQIALNDCLKLLYLSAAWLSILYLGRALLLKWIV